MPPQMSYTETLIVTSCWCGIPFAIPENLHTWLGRKDGNSCHCPNGHKMVFGSTLESDLREAREQRDAARRREGATRALLDQEERSHAATRGHLTRKRVQLQRVEAGVCPHCNRSFQNLARHMKSKHEHEVTPGT
jgi:hypothetical protein